MYNSEKLQQKWTKVLNEATLPPITSAYKKAVTAVVLNNQQLALNEERGSMMSLNEDAPTMSGFGSSGTLDKYDPILISLVRRSLPNLMAYDVAGVQPMTGPTGLIFAMKSRYTAKDGAEALFNEADTDFTGTGTHAGSNPVDGAFTTGLGMATATAENLGSTKGTPGPAFAEGRLLGRTCSGPQGHPRPRCRERVEQHFGPGNLGRNQP
jgi:hypothetical protein